MRQNNFYVVFEGVKYSITIDETVATIGIPAQSELADFEIKKIIKDVVKYCSRWHKDVATVIVDATLPEVLDLFEYEKYNYEEPTSETEEV